MQSTIPDITIDIPLGALQVMKDRILALLGKEKVGIYLDSNDYPTQKHQKFECLAAGGIKRVLQSDQGAKTPGFKDLQSWLGEQKSWAFGYFGYDLKNQIEDLKSENPDSMGFPDMCFFEPQWVIAIRKSSNSIDIFGENALEIAAQLQIDTRPISESKFGSIELRSVISRDDYLSKVDTIRQLIVEGDLYEMNLCRELMAEDVELDAIQMFRKLNAKTRAPFAAYLRLEHLHLLCASPERFIYKSEQQLISQPIKGTRPRMLDFAADESMRRELSESEKDKSENVMIVDLVRNDLSKICIPGTVKVDELFGIYSFATVHQMISTISGILPPEANEVQAIKAAFPMGSMTGAPKVRAMQRIEQLEMSRRGIYSGALGYFSPNGDFDFNVVIRSLMYNASQRKLSCQVGGAIVFDSVAEDEWLETEWKLNGIKEILISDK
ncbi:MAG: anthranilate synthase component I family protein [Saprospiraceae bacterium]